MPYPVLLRVGSITISSYGFLLSLGMVCGVFLFWRRARAEGFDENGILDLSLATLLAGTLGSRLVFVLVNFSVFSSDLSDVLRAFNAGLSWFGGLFFGFLAFWFFTRRRGWSFYKLFDLAAPALAFAQMVGGVGWFLSGLAYPTAGEETIAYFLIFLLLSVLFRARQQRIGSTIKLESGVLGFVWLLLAGGVRFVAEFYRVESLGERINLNRIFSLVSVVVAFLFLVLRYRDSLVVLFDWVRRKTPSIGEMQGRRFLARFGWLKREEEEIDKEHKLLSQDDLFFQEGRTEDNAELGDEAQELTSHEYAQAMSDFLNRFGAQVRRAIRRARRGRYGICERCGKRISPERLKAFPAATLCLSCQEEEERRSGRGGSNK